MLTHQTSHSAWEYQSHSDHFQQELTSIYLQPSLSSVSSLTLETNDQNQLSQSNTCHQCLTTIRGHTSYISSLTLAGKFLYSGSSSKEIRSWKRNPLEYFDLYNENEINNVVAEGKGAVKSLVVLADKLFSAHQDHKIRVWKINHDQEKHHDQQKLIRLATLPTLSDRAWKLLSPKNQVPIRRHKTSTWVHHVDTVSALALSKDGSLLYSVSWDRTLKIWRTSDFKCLESISNAHGDAINAVASSSDGDVYTGSSDKKIKVWKKGCEEGKHYLVATLEKHNSGINALALSSDGSVLFSGACDRSIIVWEKDDDNNLVVAGALSGHKKSILCLFVVDYILFSGSADKTIRVWRSIGRVYSCLAVLEGHQGPVKCLTAAVDRQNISGSTSYLLYSGSLDCDIKVWQINVPLP